MKSGEIQYLQRMTNDERAMSAAKPWPFPECGRLIGEVAAVMVLLPPPPLRIWDAGCGNGYTSRLLAMRGYHVTATDICPDMIATAQAQPKHANQPFYQVQDFEHPLGQEVDAVTFIDCLHHAENTRKALHAAYESLSNGGVVICHEPGIFHSSRAWTRYAKERFKTTENSLPPYRIIRLAKKVGFRSCLVYPHAGALFKTCYSGGFIGFISTFAVIALKHFYGITVLKK